MCDKTKFFWKKLNWEETDIIKTQSVKKRKLGQKINSFKTQIEMKHKLWGHKNCNATQHRT